MSVIDCGRGLSDEIQQVKICGPGLGCRPEFWGRFRIDVPTCKVELVHSCDVDRLIRVCPFDPAWDAFEWKQKLVSERLQALEVQVKELEAKLSVKK